MKQNKKSASAKSKGRSKKFSANLQLRHPVKKHPEPKPEDITHDNDFHHDHAFISPNKVVRK